MEIEIVFSWLISFCAWIVAFILLYKFRASIGTSFWLKIGAVGLCVHIAVLLSLALYNPVIQTFRIYTDGFLNFNGIMTLIVIWIVICILMLLLLIELKDPLTHYYKPLRTSLMVMISIPCVGGLLLIMLAHSK